MKFPTLLGHDLRVGLCPDRLVIQCRALRKTKFSRVLATANPLAELKTTLSAPDVPRCRLTLVLSSRYVRYAVLPWDASLTSEDEWRMYATLYLNRLYGNVAGDWHVSLSRRRAGQSRVACAVDRGLRDFLRELQPQSARARLVSAQPYLMLAFNLRRRLLNADPMWFVVQEPRYLTLGLISHGEWKSVRRRAYEHRWQDALPILIERQSADDAVRNCEQVFVWAEDAEAGIPPRLGRYLITDVTSLGASSSDRRFAMASCH